MERRTLGNNHPYTLYTLNEVAQFDIKKGRTADGISKLEEVVRTQKYVLGIDDPDTQAAMIALRGEYRKRRKTGDKEKIKELSILIGKTHVGENKRQFRICDLENGVESDGDDRRDQPSSHDPPSQTSG